MENTLNVLTAIGSIATPILVLILTGLGWFFKRSLDRKSEIESKLRDDRIEIYNEIIEPFVILLTPQTAWNADPRNKKRNKDQVFAEKYLSQDYRKCAFKLTLIADDDVVAAYNSLLQFSYTIGSNESTQKTKEMIVRLGTFLLEIRRSMGNETTRLNNFQMLEWLVTDINLYRDTPNT